MRYSFATLSLMAGELDKAVSAQMGHSDVNLTRKVYTKVLRR
jgi:integrase